MFICILVLLMIGVTMPVVIVDPFFQYHKPLKNFPYRIDNQINQNPGMAKHFEYDSVILGSSITDNFNVDKFFEYMGLKTLKLSANGAMPKDIDELLKVVNIGHSNVDKVFLGIDIFLYHDEPETTAYPLPEYLYDRNVINDAPYLINDEVITDYVLYPMIKREGTPLNEIYCNWKQMSYGREFVWTYFTKPEIIAKEMSPDAYIPAVKENLEKHILPYVEKMKDTEFVVFFPPYSILMWYLEYADGELAADICSTKYIVERLLEYDNVSVYYFQNDYEYITNLDNYCDSKHFAYQKNDDMTLEFSKKDSIYIIDGDNYEEVLDEFDRYLHNCNYEDYLNWN